MYKFTREFLEYLADKLQVGDRKPNYGVVLYRKDGQEKYDITPVTFGPNFTSIEMDRRWNMSVDELQIELDNINGVFSPDYSAKKEYDGVEELYPSGYQNAIVPFNRLRLDLGYGDQVIRSFTGQIQEVDITEETSKIVIVSKNELRKLLKPIDPIDTRTLLYENKRALEIVLDLCKRAGIENILFEVDEVKEFDYAINKAEFELGTTYKDAIDSILQSMSHRIFADRHGQVRIVKLEEYTQKDVEHWEFNDYIDLTQGSYKIDSSVIRNRIIVQSKSSWKAYEDKGLIDYCNGEKISVGIEVPWAESDEQKKQVANDFFMKIRKKLRRVTIATIGNPTMDVGDLAKLKMLTATANSKYMISGIRTSYSSSGYFDIVDLEFVTEDSNVATEAEGEYKLPDPPPIEEGNLNESAPAVVGITSKRQQVVSLAHKYLGVPYCWGGDGIRNPTAKNYGGVDCSWFTFTILNKLGLMSGYMVADGQKKWCIRVKDPQPGDLVFYSNSSGVATHVGIYIGDGKTISSGGGGPSTTSLAVAKRQNAKVKVHGTYYDRSRTVTFGTPPTLK